MEISFCTSAVKWGDVATWVSGLATVAAVFIALLLPYFSRKREEKLADLRVALLLQPSFGELNAAVVELTNWIGALDKYKQDAYLHSPEKDLLLRNFREVATKHHAAMAASSSLAVNVLYCIAWSQKIIAEIETMFPNMEVETIFEEKHQRRLFELLVVLRTFSTAACFNLDAALGDSLKIPEEVEAVFNGLSAGDED